MKTETANHCETHVARSLAAEDLRRGDFVSILHETVEYPSFWWNCDAQLWPPNQPVRLQCHTSDCGMPLKVKAICLPFVFVKKPCGQHCTLDIRRHRVVRLSPDYARPVWKILSKQSLPAPTSSILSA